VETVQQRLQISIQIGFIFGGSLAVNACRTVFTGAPVRFPQPFQIHQVSQARENQLW